MVTWLSDWFWQEHLWFPEGLGWADLQDRDGKVYSKHADLWVVIPLALCFLLVRQVFERWVPLDRLGPPVPVSACLSLCDCVLFFSALRFAPFILTIPLCALPAVAC